MPVSWRLADDFGRKKKENPCLSLRLYAYKRCLGQLEKKSSLVTETFRLQKASQSKENLIFEFLLLLLLLFFSSHG